MDSGEELSGSAEEIADMVQALFELRDMLHRVSLFLKDTLATRDLDAYGDAYAQSGALIQQLVGQATPQPAEPDCKRLASGLANGLPKKTAD